MSRSLFLLLAGIYSMLLFVSMVFTPEDSLTNYGASTVDLTHISIMQFLGLCNGAFAMLSFLSRKAPNSYSLRTILLSSATLLVAGVLLGVYHVFVVHPPMSSFFIGDSVFRLVLGLGFAYFYSREAQQAKTLSMA